jgi:alkanesulfonate monooxygenase SsuD/methylene tetrahydromethanopterin reductase-like flavin-dependent oxidoreductase (luciferase family)
MGPDLRFGYAATTFAGVDTLIEEAVQAEQAGFDSVTVADLPGALSPLVALAALARATATIELGTFVLNTGLWDPATVARDLATLDRISGGRVDIALGSGIPQPSVAGIMPPDGPARFERLRATVSAVKSSFDDPGITPGFVNRPRLRVAGAGDPVLRLGRPKPTASASTRCPQRPRFGSQPGRSCCPSRRPRKHSSNGYEATPRVAPTSWRSGPASRSC